MDSERSIAPARPLATASRVAELVFHGLAMIPVTTTSSAPVRAASLFDERYCAFVRAHLPVDARAPFEDDAALLAQLFEDVRVAHGIGWMAALHLELDALLATARSTLAELVPAQVSSPLALGALASLPEAPVELFRAAILLAAPAFDAAFDLVFGEHLSALEHEVTECARAVGPRILDGVRLSATLGLHGRVLANEIYVGATALPGEPIDPAPTLVLIAHERAVSLAHAALTERGLRSDWSTVEAVALAAEPRLLSGTPLEAAQSAWLGSLGRAGLATMDSELSDIADRIVRNWR
ncbi:MAG: hypothetical protein U0271_28860 [Polyangiaceae bacterium]